MGLLHDLISLLKHSIPHHYEDIDYQATLTNKHSNYK